MIGWPHKPAPTSSVKRAGCKRRKRCCGELKNHSFVTVRGPDADAIPIFNADGKDSAGGSALEPPKLRIGRAKVLVAYDEGFLVWDAGRDLAEVR